MRNLIRMNDYNKADILHIFDMADMIRSGQYRNFLSQKTVLLFFPASSIRTRVTYEKGIHQLGGQAILFPSEALDKKEKPEDVIRYLNNWADAVIIRHPDIEVIEELASYSRVPVINAMTGVNHPCEIISDLYALSKLRTDYLDLHYLFVGARGNIGLAWKEASDLMGFSFTQCCPPAYEMDNVHVMHDIYQAMVNKDIVLTDSLGNDQLRAFQGYQITCELMGLANENALFNPCPPFYRGEEVSADVIDSKYFVGYEFKKSLLEVQQAIILFNMMN